MKQKINYEDVTINILWFLFGIIVGIQIGLLI